jgi:phenylacetate-CoA ligase
VNDVIKNRFYAYSPVPLQELILSGTELGKRWLREGSHFRRVLEEIERTQWLSRAELDEYQARRIQQLVKHATEHVPYYRAMFRRNGVQPEDIRSPGDLSKLPYLSKSDIVHDPQAFISEHKNGRVFKGSTSGSTGAPLTLYHDLNGIVREHAHVFRILQWTGFRHGQRRAWIRGDMIVPAVQRDPPFWRMNWSANMLMFSSYHLSERNAEGYLKALAAFDPVLVQAYPSSIAYLANFLHSRARTYDGRSLRGIVTSSETLLSEHKAVIEKVFGCPVIDHYGSYERVVMISHCDKGGLHVHADYGVLELAPDAECDEIVGSGFNGRIMPLLRYKTGDRIVMDDGSRRCPCGRHWPLVKSLEGRQDDYVVTKDGRHVTRLGHVFTGVVGLAEGQIVQERAGKIRILAVPLGPAAHGLAETLRTKASERFGDMMDVRVEIVPNIARGKNGKLRAVVRHAAVTD